MRSIPLNVLMPPSIDQRTTTHAFAVHCVACAKAAMASFGRMPARDPSHHLGAGAKEGRSLDMNDGDALRCVRLNILFIETDTAPIDASLFLALSPLLFSFSKVCITWSTLQEYCTPFLFLPLRFCSLSSRQAEGSGGPPCAACHLPRGEGGDHGVRAPVRLHERQ